MYFIYLLKSLLLFTLIRFVFLIFFEINQSLKKYLYKGRFSRKEKEFKTKYFLLDISMEK